MSEAYQQKEWELDSLIDNLNLIEYTYEEYKKEVEHFIDRLLKDTKEINILRNENKQLHSIIKEARELTEMLYKNEANIFYKGTYKKQLEILDKVGSDKE